VRTTKKAAANVLTGVELFCGIGGFRVAAEGLGIKTIWANDLDQQACDVYSARFGADGVVQGDIAELVDSVPPHDVLTAGFPCQPFSAAGKKLGVKDPRGTLFQSIVDVLERRAPKYFTLENVKRILTMERGVHFATVLAALSRLPYFLEWRVLNAKHFGLAQNRERVVIVGHRIDGESPRSTAVRLLTATDARQLPRPLIRLLDAPNAWPAIEDHALKFPNWGLAVNGKFLAGEIELFSDGAPEVTLRDVLLRNPPPEYDLTESTLARLGENEPVERFVQGVEILSNQAGGARMGYTIFGIEGLAPTLTASTSRHYERYKIGDRYRRLTPVEYARLQGFSDDHCASRRGYDQYSLYGNAVPPPLVQWAMQRLLSGDAVCSSELSAAEPELFDAI
jgi:DNA (cytosine-5)-methyltransferase 1